MDLHDYLRVARRRWVLILLCTLASTGLAALYTLTATPQYSSSARLFVSTSPTDTSEAYQGSLFSAQRVTSYADLVRSQELAQAVISDLQLRASPAELSQAVSASVVPNTVILEVTAHAASPDGAQQLAQSYAESLADMVREVETPSGGGAPPIKATIVDPASWSGTPISPQPTRNLVAGAALGALVGFGTAVMREMLDNTVKLPVDLAAVDAPLLGTIHFDSSTKTSPLVTALASHAPRVESFRVLRTNLQFVDVDRPDKVFVVTSALPEEGKTTTAVNLAITLAQAGRRVLLIECDLRRPRAAQQLGLDQAVGVTTVLVGKVALDDAIQKHTGSDLHVLGSGAIPPNPAELLQSNAMAEMLAVLRRRYDMIIIDAPPLLPVTDAALIAAQSDGALLVLRYGKTTKDQLAQAVDRLSQVDAAPIGVVMNMVPTRRRARGYGYGYGYAPDLPTPTRRSKEPKQVTRGRRSSKNKR